MFHRFCHLSFIVIFGGVYVPFDPWDVIVWRPLMLLDARMLPLAFIGDTSFCLHRLYRICYSLHVFWHLPIVIVSLLPHGPNGFFWRAVCLYPAFNTLLLAHSLICFSFICYYVFMT